jgi:hypothetical protein
MKTSEITKDYKGLLICYKNEYPCGQLLYDGDQWVYSVGAEISNYPYKESTPHELVQKLIDTNIIDNIMFITYDGKNAN